MNPNLGLEVLLNIWPFHGSLIFMPVANFGGQLLVQIMYFPRSVISEDAELEEWARGVEVVNNNKVDMVDKWSKLGFVKPIEKDNMTFFVERGEKFVSQEYEYISHQRFISYFILFPIQSAGD